MSLLSELRELRSLDSNDLQGRVWGWWENTAQPLLRALVLGPATEPYAGIIMRNEDMKSSDAYAAATVSGSTVLDEYQLWEVAAVKVPSKKEDFEGGDAEILLPTTLVVAADRASAILRAASKIDVDVPTRQLKIFARPFDA